MAAKNRSAAFFLNFFFPGLGFAYFGTPSLIVAGVVFWVCTVLDSLADLQNAFDPKRLLLGLAAALSMAVIAGEFTEIFNRLPPSFRKCPFCAEEVKAEAKVCKHCSRDLEPITAPSK